MSGISLQTLPVLMQDTLYGELRWQSETSSVPLPLMRSVATMLGRGLYFNQAQKHYQQLLLMEERATIARELHDSLAQVLSICGSSSRCLNTPCRRKMPPRRRSSPTSPAS